MKALHDNMISVLITTVSVVLLFLVTVKAKETLHLGVLISQEGEFDFTGFIPAMNLALETIENDTTLPFNFTITLSDSMVSQLMCQSKPLCTQ